MKTLSGFLLVLCLSVIGVAQEGSVAGSGGQAMNQISTSAQAELSKSILELDQLRQQITAEKLPMSQELTSVEERLSQLRRDYERVSRQVDEGSLETSNIKAQMKARQEELSYVGNLLDEYARTFESKVNVSELQYCGDAIESAKDAGENTTLSPNQKFQKQLSFVVLSVNRLFDVVGGMRFPGVGVDLQGNVVEGQYAIIGPVALFLAKSGGVAGLVVPQSGSTKPLIRPLEGVLQSGIATLVESGSGSIPLDPSRGGALKALVQRTNIIHIFEKGGPIMWPLLIASVLALGTVLERLLFLMNEKRKRDTKALETFFASVKHGELEAARALGKTSKFYVVRALNYALDHKDESLEGALEHAKAQEMKRFSRGIPILDTVITLAPLLGLLGTVTGMMGSFSLIGGELNSPGAITGGIAEALIATAFGLGIAITALLPFNFLNARMDEAQHELDSAAAQLTLMMQANAGGPGTTASHTPSNGPDKHPAAPAPKRELVNT